MDTSTASRLRPLSAEQERKLVDYLEEHLADIKRNHTKRNQPSSTLPTLAAYLTATHQLLTLVLQIPPLDPSASLRTALLLRLTGEVLSAVIHYPPDAPTLPQLLAWLQDLDSGWLAVLRAQPWDPAARAGVDMDVDVDGAARRTPPSQTERTRLRSLLITGTNDLEEWLAGLDADAGGADCEEFLRRLGLQQGFDELFAGTLAEMGSLRGSLDINGPEGMEGTC